MANQRECFSHSAGAIFSLLVFDRLAKAPVFPLFMQLLLGSQTGLCFAALRFRRGRYPVFQKACIPPNHGRAGPFAFPNNDLQQMMSPCLSQPPVVTTT